MGRHRETVEQAYAAVNAGDLDGFLTLTHPEAEFRSLIAESEDPTFRGLAGAREWWETVSGLLGGLRVEALEFHESEDWVVSRLRVTGEIGGVEVPQRMWQALRFRDGKAIWWSFFRTEEEALETAGIERSPE